MTIDVARMSSGQLAMISDRPFPAQVKHIEYYKEQKLFQLVFADSGTEDMLVTRELDPDAARIVETAPDIVVVVSAGGGTEPHGYDVPLIQIGV